MRFLNRPRCFFIALLANLLVGCGTHPLNDTQASVVETAEISETVSTLAFLPQVKKDKAGKELAYRAQANPYIKRLSFVRSEAINQFKQAQEALDAGDMLEAKTIALTMTRKYKKLSGPWVVLGDVALNQQEYSQAEKHYSKALEVNPDNVNAYLRLAQVKRIQGRFVEAKNVYADALLLWKDFPEAHLNLAVLYDLYMNDDVKAQKHIEAYQFLTNGVDDEVALWLKEIASRTGMPITLQAQTFLSQKNQ